MYGDLTLKMQVMTFNPKISIITVVFNSKDFIERTIESIKNQGYRNIEYIVVDGASTDGTLQLIEKYKPDIYKYISEPDKGLYDAMNKGLKLASGDYVCFLNSGDQLFSNDTLNHMFGNLTELPDIIYGETMIVDIHGNEIGLRRLKAPENLTWESFKKGMLVCHQSVYVKRSIAPEYDLKYKIASDFDWVSKVLKNSRIIHNSGQILTRFLDGGLNKQNIRKALIERFKIMTKNYGFFPTLFRHIAIGLKFFIFFIKNKRF
jgi:glycosyltransferase involved in cell wall biosynthesis